MAVSDEELMRQVQAGRHAAFETLVARYRPVLVRVAVSKLGDRALGEDAAQETLLAVFAARHTFNPRYSFRTWLWTILLHLCAQQWKRQQSSDRCGGVIDPQVADATANNAETALDALLRTERSDLLQRALLELPEPQADALRLRFFAGLTFDEVAAAMSSSVSGAKQRVKHGLERLAHRLRTLQGVEP
uniref:RNA polymerase sigma factor n=1 Tax=Schlesneria paludicola TaxID=360056 RepID=A0A7C2NXW5_9PLAN